MGEHRECARATMGELGAMKGLGWAQGGAPGRGSWGREAAARAAELKSGAQGAAAGHGGRVWEGGPVARLRPWAATSLVCKAGPFRGLAENSQKAASWVAPRKRG